MTSQQEILKIVETTTAELEKEAMDWDSVYLGSVIIYQHKKSPASFHQRGFSKTNSAII